jgi:hypothetical protein
MRNGFYFEAEAFPPNPIKLFKIYWYRKRAVPTREWSEGIWSAIVEYFKVPEIHAGGMGEFILNTEEVATLFHLPTKIHGFSGSASTAVKSDPPLNLPV